MKLARSNSKKKPLKTYQAQFVAAVCNDKNFQPLSIRATPLFSVEKRISIYRYAYLARLQESLTDDCERVIAKLCERHGKRLGRTKWNEISKSYLKVVFPKTYTLYDLVFDLPKYLRKIFPKDGEIYALAQMDALALIVDNQEVIQPPSPEALSIILASPDLNQLVVEIPAGIRVWWGNGPAEPQGKLQKQAPSFAPRAFTPLPGGVQEVVLTPWESQWIRNLQKNGAIPVEVFLDQIVKTLCKLHKESPKNPSAEFLGKLSSIVFESVKKLSTNGVILIKRKEAYVS